MFARHSETRIRSESCYSTTSPFIWHSVLLQDVIEKPAQKLSSSNSKILPSFYRYIIWTNSFTTFRFLHSFKYFTCTYITSKLLMDIKQDAETLEILDDFNAEGRKKITALRSRIADLERLGLEQEKDTDRNAIEVNVKNLRQKLSSTVSSLREATVTAKVSLDKKMKEELLSGSSEVRKRTQGNRESLAKCANDISQNLVSLNQTLEEQVKQSEMNATTLHYSSKMVRATHDEFHSMGGHIQHSRRLLTKYGRREFTDRLLILLALVFFFATVIYIMKKRLWS